MAPTTQRAVVVAENGTVVLKDSIPVPKPGPNEVLIKVVAAAQNPTDWKTAQKAARVGAVSGCDFAGIVEEIGSAVPEGVRTIGERVAGFVRGGISSKGAFSEYLTASAQYGIVRIPDNWTFEEGAQLGVASLTALQTLYESHHLPTPLEPTSTPIPVLVSGGATAVGQYVIQIAKLSGLYIVATASKKNFDFVNPREGVTTIFSGAPVLLGEDLEYPTKRILTPEDRKRGLEFVDLLSKILATGKVKPNPLLILPKGLASVPEGFQYMLDGKVSAQKLVYRIADTPNL
ncbi:dehydrogenase [Artomyces pyxidatus]|uniref:Dehydrogenase n=1 Tax=Artomyces pyxidatus TaxID=48021 RepID=A0ACB8SRU2_9AGAM|nr:dehydrogenase [Artomyces pyxidatus]